MISKQAEQADEERRRKMTEEDEDLGGPQLPRSEQIDEENIYG